MLLVSAQTSEVQDGSWLKSAGALDAGQTARPLTSAPLGSGLDGSGPEGGKAYTCASILPLKCTRQPTLSFPKIALPFWSIIVLPCQASNCTEMPVLVPFSALGLSQGTGSKKP